TRHQHIEDDRVGPAQRKRAYGLAAVARGPDLEAVQAEHQRERLAHGRIVIDDEQAHGASMLPRNSEKQLRGARRDRPRPGVLLARAAAELRWGRQSSVAGGRAPLRAAELRWGRRSSVGGG